jgi:hypothetical protein
MLIRTVEEMKKTCDEIKTAEQAVKNTEAGFFDKLK